ncbi:circadian locomoter output cycles protein kaput-like [Penaeus japonicus]|uniref:circadian locomoter output cycles protein kaput-like n=1 Tax=Penaeus japonicus TaxID=27405 RepID=UPI001C70DF71|nr:circadian locomoter output cycles protein kaput-like [Penaeus japonicus]
MSACSETEEFTRNPLAPVKRRSLEGGTSQRGSRSTMGSENKYPSSSREMRNIAEKMRRDKLNNYVTELASIVPLVSGANKRVDKTSVLRLAANFIRIHKILQDDEPRKHGLPCAVDSVVSQSLSQAIGGFLMVVTSTGKVLYVSEAMEEIFGHSQVDLLGRSIYHVIHPEDYEIIQEQLNSKDTSRRSFFCRMMEKALSRNEPSRYEIVHIVGSIRMLLQPGSSLPRQSASHDQVVETIRDTCDKSLSDSEDRMGSDSDGDDSQTAPAVNKVGTHLLVAFVRVVKDRPITELSLVESTQDEYITRHSMDGKILYTDHRISFVTGLMPQEVLGTSAFHYMHPDDLVWSIVAHKLMFNSSQGQGMVSYRLKCKGSKFVTLRSRGYIESNKQTGQAETFVCINTVVSSKETESEIKSQRRKLLPMVTTPQGDSHLTTVSSAMPPELLSAMKKMLDPQYVKKLLDSIDDMGFEASMELKITATNQEWKEDDTAETFSQHLRNQAASMSDANNQSRDQETSAEFSISKNSKKRALEGTLSPQPKKFCSSDFFRELEVPQNQDFRSTNSIPEQNQSFHQSNCSHSNSSVYGSHNASLLIPQQHMTCDMSTRRTAQAPASSLRPYYDSGVPQPPRSSEGVPHTELRKGFHLDHTAQSASTNQSKGCNGAGGIPGLCENQASDVSFSNHGFPNNPRCVETALTYRQSEANSSPMYPSIAAQNSPSLIRSSQTKTFIQGEQSGVVPSFVHSTQTDQNFHYSSRMDVSIRTQRQQQYMQQSERQSQSKQHSLKQQETAQNPLDQHRQHSPQNQQVHINCQQSLQNYQSGRSYQQTRQQQEQNQKTVHQFHPGAIFQQSIQTEHAVQPQQSDPQFKQLNMCQRSEMPHQQSRHHHQQEMMHHQQLRQPNQLELQHQQSRHQQSEQQYQQTRHHQSDLHQQQRRQQQHHLHQQQPGQIQYMNQQTQDRPQTQLNTNLLGQSFPAVPFQQSPLQKHWQPNPSFCHSQIQNGNYELQDSVLIATSPGMGMHRPGSTIIQTKSSGPQF